MVINIGKQEKDMKKFNIINSKKNINNNLICEFIKI